MRREDRPIEAAKHDRGCGAFFDLTAPSPRERDDGRIPAFCLFLLLHEAARFALWSWLGEARPTAVPVALTLASVACLAAGFFRSVARIAVACLVLLLLARTFLTFPTTPNHGYLALFAAALVAFCGFSTPEERSLLLSSCRWLAAGVLFHAGMQKFAHGTYFRGEFLATQIALDEPLGGAIARMLPAEEVSRLRSLDPYAGGAGPFRLESWIGVAVSNLVWISEVVFAVGLLASRTRRLALSGAILMLFSIEVFAREIFYGLLVLSLLLLFAPLNLSLWALFASSLVYLALLATKTGLLPAWFFN